MPASRTSSKMPTIPKPADAAKAFFRLLVPNDAAVQVRPMFGNEAAFVNGNMFAGLYGDAVFVRLEEEPRATLLKEPGARRFEPMPGRPMKEYVVLPDAWRTSPARARPWVERSWKWVASFPPKAAKSKRPAGSGRG